MEIKDMGRVLRDRGKRERERNEINVVKTIPLALPSFLSLSLSFSLSLSLCLSLSFSLFLSLSLCHYFSPSLTGPHLFEFSHFLVDLHLPFPSMPFIRG